MKIASPEYRYQHLGRVYRLIEQFELISRTDLAKLSGFAPASMTMLTKLLIENQFIIERTSQNLASRGRPAVGLSLSPFHWALLCLTVSSNKVTVALCQLNGSPIAQETYSFSEQDHEQLSLFILQNLQHFIQHNAVETDKLFAVSVSVVGKINATKDTIVQLGHKALTCELKSTLSSLFSQPIFINEHFQLWFLAESTLGNLISDDDVIYLQLDNDVNLSVLLKGALLHQDEHKRMNVDKMLMPQFPLSDEIGAELPLPDRYQLKNQVTFPALLPLIDRYLPNAFNTSQEKIDWFCEHVEQQTPNAIKILEHITDNLAYMLMNLINLFSTPKVMINSPLLRIKPFLFTLLHQKLHSQRLLGNINVDLVTSQYDWDSAYIPAVAIKLGLYEGTLLKHYICF